MACPYAHRAMLALELRPVRSLKQDSTSITTTNQFMVINKLGLKPEHDLGMLAMHADKTVDVLHMRKDAYKRDVNPSGEVPSLLLASGDVVCESEIVCEYLDAVSEQDSPRLVPADPLAAARVRMAMKLFNAVPPAMVSLLKNQDEARDEPLAAALDTAVERFVVVTDQGNQSDQQDARFCVGDSCTLADVHAAPFIFRFAIVLKHYRGYCLLTRHPRLGSILRAVEALPAWSAVLCPLSKAYPPVTERALIGLYAAYANDGHWLTDSDGKPYLAGRGVSRLSCVDSQPFQTS
eukprot:CAMPEP_0174705478 /NCGR_PEP_ID=MMETSP1094-20130205/8690_1 /TAXON_ID=156173 /ORGANISM="Chrysochromulina brevifilum, Strain UTEX LB 985" /LENGTH=292 /DNA_ID=CAMNT_0015903649 /DNA_START=77 /DNA_END=955 /DNA_ORIENTATION=+